jgi:quercetin dioxygenase-like cupin family protein
MKLIRLLIIFTIITADLANAQEVTMSTTQSVLRKDLLSAMITSAKTISRIEIKEVTMGPKVIAPLHLHPCPVVGVIIEGTISFQIEGENVQYLKTDDAFYEPADERVARFDNDGEIPAKFAAFYLLGKDENELIRMLSK